MSSLNSHKSLFIPAALLAVVVLAAGLLVSNSSVLAGHGNAGLANSNFEIDSDANLKVDHTASPSLDWASVAEARQDEASSGSGDDAFGKGTKEDTAAPSPVNGSIPPNKSDLKTFGVYVEDAGANKFMHLFWARVQDPSGTTNMDFEFNQSDVDSGNEVTPMRTDGDLLIEYKLSKGGTVPYLFLYRWIDGSGSISDCETASALPCWGHKMDLTAAGNAAGSINTHQIPAIDSDGLGILDPYTFGEATLNLDVILDDSKCTSFGSAYLKSRSSDSFSSAVKDYIRPLKVSITNCGQVIIRKVTSPAGASESFSFQHTVPTDPAGGSSFSLQDDGAETISNVLVGNGYTVTEDDANGSGFELTGIDCSASINVAPIVDVLNRQITFDFDSAGDIVDCTYANKLLPKVKLIKSLNPATDTGKFDLDISQGGTVASNDEAGHGDQAPDNVGFVTVDAGMVTVSESADGETTLRDYDRQISCDSLKGSAAPNSTTYQFAVTYGDVVTCTITNSRLPRLTLVKVVDPDGGLFNLFDGATQKATDVGNHSVGPFNTTLGLRTVSETAGTNTNLGDYESSVECGGAPVASTQIDITLNYGDNVTCRFTNTELNTLMVITCRQGVNTLVGSEVTPDNSVTAAGHPTTTMASGQIAAEHANLVALINASGGNTSVGELDGIGLTAGVLEEFLCTLGGAAYIGQLAGYNDRNPPVWVITNGSWGVRDKPSGAPGQRASTSLMPPSGSLAWGGCSGQRRA